MTREAVIGALEAYFDEGGLFDDLARRVAIPTESQNPARHADLARYLTEEMTPYIEALGFETEVFENTDPRGGPFLLARRIEDPDLPTVLSYGHGDVILGHEGRWEDDRDPWSLTKAGDRWYGRGTADNKVQHTINLVAVKACLEARERLGFNMTMLIETSEECGSVGLREFCLAHRDRLKADVFIASDGPRMRPDLPTVYFGSRGVFNFNLSLDLRDGGHHSGNWGGLLANPGTIICNAIASMVDGRGRINVAGLRPPPMPNSVRAAIAKLKIGGGPNEPEIDPDWGEPGLSPAERLIAWNTLEVLALECGDAANPVHAIPPRASAACHIRYVVDSDPETFLEIIRAHLEAAGFGAIEVTEGPARMGASRLDPDHPWARWVVNSLKRTAGQDVAVMPNLGGSIPNDIFADIIGMPTIWVPHSYPGCSQHAPNEHILEEVSRSGLRLMGGLFWDLGDGTAPH